MKNRIRFYLFASLCLLVVFVTGCSKSDDPQAQITVTDPTTIVEGSYKMTYISDGNTNLTLPFTNTNGTFAGQISFARLSSSSSTATMVVTVNGTPMLTESPVIYMKLLNQTTVEFYNEAALTTRIGTGTKNSIDINAKDTSGQTLVLKATR